MQRGSAGPRRVVLPRELVPVGSRVEHDNSGEACTSKSRCVRATLFVGDGLQTVPVELVSAQRVAKRQVTGRAGAGPPIADKDALRHDVPPLTPELRGDLKQKLDSLVSVCRTDFKAHPRSVRFFLRELWEVCQLLKVPCLPRPYRKNLAGPLQQFVMNIPNWLPADLAPSSAELSEDSFITLTVMLALDSIPWEFKFNQTTYRLCNCRTTFGSNRCLLPTGWLRPSEFALPSGRSLSRSGARQRRVSHATPNDQFQGDVSSAAGYSRMDLLQKQERHLSTRLLDVSAALRVRFLEFVQQVPVFLEDLLKCTVEKPAAEQIAHQRLLWDRWANLVISEITAFDKSYTQFERLYMTIVEQLMETTLEPLRSMAKTCDALLSTSGDPFREVQAASLCQRLGLLKQDVDFGGRNQVMHFDSSLLEKAHRVLQMETYAEVQEMARALIQDFESLCKVLLHLNDNQAKPELKENAELTSAILRLEQVWADCQFILHQGCLDFIEVLEREVLPQLSPMLRWQIGIALGCSEGRPLDPDVTQADIKAAKVALYQTVPMMVYVEELWRDANPEESSCRKLRFVELCCPQDDRHHTLRRDFGKFDEKRFNEFRTFITDDEQNRGGANRQTDFFRLVYRQLKAVAAFPVQENFAAAVLAASKAQENLKQPGLSDQDIAVVQREQELLEGGARWICLMLKVQAVAPGLFPKKPPEKSDKDPPRHNSKGRRMSAATHLAGRRGSTVNAWEALEAVKEG